MKNEEGKIPAAEREKGKGKRSSTTTFPWVVEPIEKGKGLGDES